MNTHQDPHYRGRHRRIDELERIWLWTRNSIRKSEPTVEPAGLPAMWITESQKEDAELVVILLLSFGCSCHPPYRGNQKHSNEIHPSGCAESSYNIENNATVVEELFQICFQSVMCTKCCRSSQGKSSIRDPFLFSDLANGHLETKKDTSSNMYAILLLHRYETYKNENNLIPVIYLIPTLRPSLKDHFRKRNLISLCTYP